ncbi:MAG: sensor histidine kinase [Patescibacteria group bacterium]
MKFFNRPIKTRYWYWLWKTFLGPSRLRRKFVRVFLIAGIVPLVLMGVATMYLVNLTHRIDVQAIEQIVANETATEIEKYVSNVIAEFDLIVTFEEFAPIAFNQQDIILEGIMTRIPSLREASFVCVTPQVCTTGQETSRWARDKNQLFKHPSLRTIVSDPAFLEAREGRQYFSPISFVNNDITVSFATPILNKNSQIIAVILGTMTNAAFQDIIRTTTLEETGYAYLVDREGTIIAHRDAEFIGRAEKENPTVQSFIAAAEEEKKTETAFYDGVIGEKVSGAWAGVTGMNLGVIVEWPREETQRLIRTITWQIIGFSLFALIVLMIIASWTAFKLIQPIAELRQGTSVIGSGNFAYRVDIKTGDELEDLGANLNKMAESLKGLEELKELRLRANLLSESLRKEQDLSKLKDQFITTLSHQLNTPLSVINWAAASFEDPNTPPDKIKESAGAITESARSISDIVNDLLTLSQIDFASEKTNAKNTPITPILAQALDHLKHPAETKGITISFINKAEHVTANANAFMLEKAFENLIDNAVDYSHENSTVTVTLSEDAEHITLAVQDTGIGIPQEDKQSIFQQFFRARNATQKKNVGTGLGLFIVKSILEQHGGSVWFDSIENKGSVFFATLPKAK